MEIDQIILPNQIKKLEIGSKQDIFGHYAVINEAQLSQFSNTEYLVSMFEKCSFIAADDIHVEYVSIITKILTSNSKKYKDTLDNPQYFETNEKIGFRHNNNSEDEIATYLVSTEGFEVSSIFKYCFLNGLIVDNQEEYQITEKGEYFLSINDYQILNDYLLYRLKEVISTDNILINYSILLLGILSNNQIRSTNLEDIIFTAIKLTTTPITKHHITTAINSLQQIITLIYPTLNIDPQPGQYLIIGNEFKDIIEKDYDNGFLIDLSFDDSYLLEDILETM